MYLFLPYQDLNRFSDVVLLRDPRGKSIFRSLHHLGASRGSGGKGAPSRPAGIAVTGPFLLHQMFTVTREQGISFVTATGDENPIHREGDVVPGAMTGARAVSSLEALFPRLGVTRVRIKFTAVARYGRPMRQQIVVSFRERGVLEARMRIEQEGVCVAEGQVAARIFDSVPRPGVGKWRVNKEELKRVEEFFRSLGIAPDLYLRAESGFNYSYPRGFLASLPSGEMVRQLSGEGGYLTTLDLGFPEGPPPGITGAGRPEVSLETARRRPSFWKIVTRIRQGLEEHCKGFALVFSPSAAAGSA